MLCILVVFLLPFLSFLTFSFSFVCSISGFYEVLDLYLIHTRCISFMQMKHFLLYLVTAMGFSGLYTPLCDTQEETNQMATKQGDIVTR